VAMGMRVTGRVRWRAGVAVLTAAAFAIGVLWGAIPRATAGEQKTRVFSGSTGIVLNYVKPSQVAVFERTMRRVGDALSNSESLDRRRQAATWKVYKATDPLDGGIVLYLSILDPVVVGADYWVPQILNEAFPTEVQALYETYAGSFADGQILLNLSPVAGS
jgi:hypothetical protein